MSTSRAVLLPHPADPFLLSYWLHFFNEVWGDEVDRLYIYINSPIDRPIVDEMIAECRKYPKINVQYEDHQVEHGTAIDRMLDICTEDHVMLIEDDGFIFKRGVVDEAFKMLESRSYDIVGSARGSCSQEIWDVAGPKWDLSYLGAGDVGPNFWPCFFFTYKHLLTETDRNFAARRWEKGEKIAGLDHIAQDDCYGDTFVNTSLQLRGRVHKDRILMIPQYHGSPYDVQHHEKGQYLFDGRASWVHVGSLSSGVHGVLMDDNLRPLARRFEMPKTKLPSFCNSEDEKKEWERRVSFWEMFWEFSQLTPVKNEEMIEFHNLYRRAIDRIIDQYGLSIANIRQRKRIYRSIGL